MDTKWDNYLCGGNQFVIQIPGVRKEDLNKVLLKAYREFYIRPLYAWILFKRIVHPVEFFSLISFGFGYIKRFLNLTD